MRPRSRILTILALLALAGIGWRALTLGMAEHYAATDPERALQWRSTHAGALARRAEQLAEASEWSDAAELARAALQSSPLQQRAYRVLARAAEASGDTESAYGLYRIAARHLPRDLPTRTWLYNHHISHGNAKAAISDLDTMLRARPQLIPALAGIIVGVATEAETQPAFAAALGSAPPWRASVLPLLVQQVSDLDSLARLLAALRAQPSGLDDTTQDHWIERLIRERRYADAYVQWVSDLPAAQREVIGNVFNGGFDFPISDGGFDWRTEPVVGARLDLQTGETAKSGSALRISFDDQRVAFHHLKQLLLLPPGRYRLDGRVRLDELRNDRGLVWELRCAEDMAEIAIGTPLSGSAPWQDFALDFDVPSADCTAQWLQLVLRARIPSEQRINGSVSFDALRIVRQ